LASGTCPALDLYGSTHGNGSAGIEDLPSGILQFLLEVTDACYVVADVLLIGRKFYPAFMEADLAMGWLFFFTGAKLCPRDAYIIFILLRMIIIKIYAIRHPPRVFVFAFGGSKSFAFRRLTSC